LDPLARTLAVFTVAHLLLLPYTPSIRSCRAAQICEGKNFLGHI